MRLRRTEPLSPEAERALREVDAVLAGESVESELAELAVALRETRPRPRPEFADALDARVAARFADGGDGESAARGRRGMGGNRRLVPIFGAAATLVVVTAVGISQSGLGERDVPTVLPPSSGDQPVESAREEGSPEAVSPAARSAEQRAQTREATPPETGAGDRQVARNAEMVLSAGAGDVPDVADDVFRVTDRHGGFVVSSEVRSGDRGGAGADFDLRIPATKLQPALRDLSALAHVSARTEGTEDVTRRFVSARERLAEATKLRDDLLRQRAVVGTEAERAAIEARLRIARARIADARAALRAVANTIELVPLGVTIEADSGFTGGWSLGDALDDAVRVLAVALGVLLVSLAVLVPLAALALLAWWAWSRYLRAQRERALDA